MSGATAGAAEANGEREQAAKADRERAHRSRTRAGMLLVVCLRIVGVYATRMRAHRSRTCASCILFLQSTS